MFNPQMMGMNGQAPNVPTVKELWKDEKNKYRHWIILLGIGLVAVFAVLLAAFIMNAVNKGSVHTADMTAVGKNTSFTGSGTLLELTKTIFTSGDKNLTAGDAIDNAESYFLRNFIIFAIIKLILLFAGVALYVITVFQSYKAKNFAKLSSWPTMVVGIAAIMAFFSLIPFGGGVSFSTQLKFPGGIFEFTANILFIVIYFLASSPVSRLRRMFMTAERVEKLKNDPQYQAMQAQMQQMMQGGNPYVNPAPPQQAAQAQPGAPVQGNKPQQPVQPVQPVNEEKAKLEKMTVSQLRDVAKELSISGSSKMTKNELIDSILKVTGNE